MWTPRARFSSSSLRHLSCGAFGCLQLQTPRLLPELRRAALLVDEVFPEQPVRQWVLSVPFSLRFLFASRPEVMGGVLGIVYRCIATHLIKKAGFSRRTAQTGAVTLIDGARPGAPPCGRPAVVQIGNPADLSLPGWPPWCPSRG